MQGRSVRATTKGAHFDIFHHAGLYFAKHAILTNSRQNRESEQTTHVYFQRTLSDHDQKREAWERSRNTKNRYRVRPLLNGHLLTAKTEEYPRL